MLVYCFFQILWACIEGIVAFVSKFAIVIVSITGLPFIEASKQVVEILKRNGLQTYYVWNVPILVLSVPSFGLALLWSFASTLLQGLVLMPVKNEDVQIGATLIVSLISLFTFWVIVSFVTSTLITAVDALYVCFAIDVDDKAVGKQEVHDVFRSTPAIFVE